MADPLQVLGVVIFAVLFPVVLLGIARRARDGGPEADGGPETDGGPEADDAEETTTEASNETIGQYRRGRK